MIQLPSWAEVDRWERHQRPVFEEICARFDDGNNLVLVDAPCGAGKSLLGFMVHQYLDTSSLVLVGTKTLQDQYERTFPEIALIKGRSNYIPLNVQEHSTWRDPTCQDCDLDESGLCTYCDISEDCPYLVARTEASEAPIACTNMAYAFGEWMSPRSKFRNRGLVIVDECDTTVGELLSHVEISISPRMQKTLHVYPPQKKTVESSWPAWFDYAVPHVERELKKLPNRTHLDKRFRTTVERLLEKLKKVHNNIEGWVYEYDSDYIRFKPVVVNDIAPDVLWKNGQRFLAMSASLGSPEQFVANLGWDQPYATVFAPSTFDKERRPIFFVPSAYMSKKTELEEWPKMAQAVEVTIDRYADKNILVHTHSGGLTRFIANALEEHERDIFWYPAGDQTVRKEAIVAFESTPGSVLLAPSLDRGYDNSSVDVVVICKVPFPYLGSKQVEKRFYHTKDGRLWFANTTAQSVAQMYGRVMRAEDDSGITIILDSVFSKFYADWKKEDRKKDNGERVRQHRLFPSWVTEALHLESTERFEITREIKRRRRELLNVSSP